MEKMTLAEHYAFFNEFFYKYKSAKGSLRVGQALMNALHSVRPDIYKEIAGTDVDPFYVEEKADPFIDHLVENYANEAVILINNKRLNILEFMKDQSF